MTILIKIESYEKETFDKLKGIGFYFTWIKDEIIIIEILGQINEVNLINFLNHLSFKFEFEIYANEKTKKLFKGSFKENEIKDINNIDSKGYKMIIHSPK